MFNFASHPTTDVQTTAEAPVAGPVCFEIGAIIVIHLAMAFFVTIVLQAFAPA